MRDIEAAIRSVESALRHLRTANLGKKWQDLLDKKGYGDYRQDLERAVEHLVKSNVRSWLSDEWEFYDVSQDTETVQTAYYYESHRPGARDPGDIVVDREMFEAEVPTRIYYYTEQELSFSDIEDVWRRVDVYTKDLMQEKVTQKYLQSLLHGLITEELRNAKPKQSEKEVMEDVAMCSRIDFGGGRGDHMEAMQSINVEVSPVSPVAVEGPLIKGHQFNFTLVGAFEVEPHPSRGPDVPTQYRGDKWRSYRPEP